MLAAPPQGKNKSEPMPGTSPGHNAGRLLQGWQANVLTTLEGVYHCRAAKIAAHSQE